MPLRASNIILIALTAGLAAVTVDLFTQDIDTAPTHATRVASAPRISAPDVAPDRQTIPGLAELSETRQRPLFEPQRRPAAADAAPAATRDTDEAAQPAADLKLVGLMASKTSGARALIRSDDGAQANWFQLGDDVEGWTLKEIQTDRVMLSRESRATELRLFPAVSEGVD